MAFGSSLPSMQSMVIFMSISPDRFASCRQGLPGLLLPSAAAFHTAFTDLGPPSSPPTRGSAGRESSAMDSPFQQQGLAASLPSERSELLAGIFRMAEPAVSGPQWAATKRPGAVLTFKERLRAERECPPAHLPARVSPLLGLIACALTIAT